MRRREGKERLESRVGPAAESTSSHGRDELYMVSTYSRVLPSSALQLAATYCAAAVASASHCA